MSGRCRWTAKPGPLPEPFFVIATQNPEEFYGTYPLPESQLDRFFMRVKIGYPPQDTERKLIEQRRGVDPFDKLQPVVAQDDLIEAQNAVTRVRINGEVIDYLHAIVLATRGAPTLAIGASTRAALFLERAACAYAVVQGRVFAAPDDVKTVAVAVLAHRVRVAGARDQHVASGEAERSIREILAHLPAPV